MGEDRPRRVVFLAVDGRAAQQEDLGVIGQDGYFAVGHLRYVADATSDQDFFDVDDPLFVKADAKDGSVLEPSQSADRSATGEKGLSLTMRLETAIDGTQAKTGFS